MGISWQNLHFAQQIERLYREIATGARELGMNLIDAGHFYTENPVVAVLAQKIREKFPQIEVIISKTHADCMKFY